MDFLIILAPILGILMFFGIQASVRAPGTELNRKFVSLGNLRGKSYAEIFRVCGSPSSVTAINGGFIKQWIAPGYHIVLLFDKDDICLGIRSETKV